MTTLYHKIVDEVRLKEKAVPRLTECNAPREAFSTVAVTSSAYEIAWDVQQAARLVQERTRQRLDAKAKRIAHFRSSVVARVEAVEKAKRAQEAKRQLQLAVKSEQHIQYLKGEWVEHLVKAATGEEEQDVSGVKGKRYVFAPLDGNTQHDRIVEASPYKCSDAEEETKDQGGERRSHTFADILRASSQEVNAARLALDGWQVNYKPDPRLSLVDIGGDGASYSTLSSEASLPNGENPSSSRPTRLAQGRGPRFSRGVGEESDTPILTEAEVQVSEKVPQIRTPNAEADVAVVSHNVGEGEGSRTGDTEDADAESRRGSFHVWGRTPKPQTPPSPEQFISVPIINRTSKTTTLEEDAALRATIRQHAMQEEREAIQRLRARQHAEAARRRQEEKRNASRRHLELQQAEIEWQRKQAVEAEAAARAKQQARASEAAQKHQLAVRNAERAAERYVDALRRLAEERMEGMKVQLPPLCSCAPGTSPLEAAWKHCAANCMYYRRPKKYTKDLLDLLRGYKLL